MRAHHVTEFTPLPRPHGPRRGPPPGWMTCRGSWLSPGCPAPTLSGSRTQARGAQPRPVSGPSMAEPQTAVVLVHGAFADATGWQHVIPLLEREGFFVTAVQNALGSLADDIATTRRGIDAQKGAVVLVGHSYGGAVITGAAIDRPHVKALVYVAAFAPDVGDTLNGLQARFSRTELWDALVRDSAGFLYIDRDRFHDVFSK